MKRSFLSLSLLLLTAGLAVAQTMSEPVNVSNSAGMSRWGQVAFTPDGVVHMVWEDDYRIVYMSYDGKSYSPPFYIKANPGVFAAEPYITTGKDGSIYVGWMENDNNGDNHGINFMIRQYDPQSHIWLPREEVAAGYLEHEPPALAVDSFGNIYCAWTNYGQGVSNTRCKINGEWGPVTRMNANGGRGKYTAIASGPDDRIWCVWGEKDGEGNYKTHYSFRTKDGNWTPKRIMNLTAGDQDRPNIAVDPTTNIPHVIYVNIDEVLGTFAGPVIICKIDGQTNPLETAINPKLQHYAKLTIDRFGNKHVAVQTGPGDYGSGIQYTNNIGGKWKAPVGMPNATGHPKLPGIATDGQNVALVWGSHISETNKEIWFSSLYPVTIRSLHPPTDLKTVLSFGEPGSSSKITYGLSWRGDARNDDSSIKGYKIYSRISASERYVPVLSVPKATLEASFSYPQINGNTSFAISTVDVDGYESALGEFPASFPEAKAPVGMKCIVSAKGIFRSPKVSYQLIWTGNPDNPPNFIKHYRIYWKANGGTYALAAQIPGHATSLSHTPQNSLLRMSFGISMVTALDTETAVVPFE